MKTELIKNRLRFFKKVVIELSKLKTSGINRKMINEIEEKIEEVVTREIELDAGTKHDKMFLVTYCVECLKKSHLVKSDGIFNGDSLCKKHIKEKLEK